MSASDDDKKAEAKARMAEALEKVWNGPTTSKLTDRVVLPALEPVAKEAGALIGGMLRFVGRLPGYVADGTRRVIRLIEEAYERVPPERQIEPPEQAVILLLTAARHVPQDTPVWDMFAELLAKTIDRDAFKKVHPAFATLLGQMSPDEARIVAWLATNHGFGQLGITYHEAHRQDSGGGAIHVSSSLDVPPKLREQLDVPEMVELQLRNLERLGLLEGWGYTSLFHTRSAGAFDAPESRSERLHLTPFGLLFAEAATRQP